MHLLLTAIDQEGQLREFSCEIPSLEVIFDVLNDIVSKGHTLSKATIQEGSSSISLPVEAFDGDSFLTALQELEQEWQSVLTKLSKPSIYDQERLLLIQKQSAYYQRRIEEYTSLINHLTVLKERTNNFFSFREKAPRAVLHYMSMIRQNERKLVKAYLLHQATLDRLSELSGKMY